MKVYLQTVYDKPDGDEQVVTLEVGEIFDNTPAESRNRNGRLEVGSLHELEPGPNVLPALQDKSLWIRQLSRHLEEPENNQNDIRYLKSV